MKSICKNWLLFPLLFCSSASLAAQQKLTAIWANTGEDKVTQDELRGTQGQRVLNPVWDGTKVAVFGGRNEVVAFNLILEAGSQPVPGVSVSFDRLKGPGGATLISEPASGSGLFNWTQRPIELFYVRYLQIKGLSRLSYEVYDERHIPERMRRPFRGNGKGYGKWEHRPDHDKFYPDIAVPLELVPTFSIAARSNQSIWVDIYIPKTAAPGEYRGTLSVLENDTPVAMVPVHLTVHGFTLPDIPSAKTMLYYSGSNINKRYVGEAYVSAGSVPGQKAAQIRDRHYMVAHRHRFSLIGDSSEDGGAADATQPAPETLSRLDGKLFTPANGYQGPGVGVGNNVYSIGTYGSWRKKIITQADIHRYTDAWASWFSKNSPNTEYFLYLIDESSDTAQVETWSKWVLANPGPGKAVKTLATVPLPAAARECPSLDIPTATMGVGVTDDWQRAADGCAGHKRKRVFMYNGGRPASGSAAIEDDGIALRQRAWAHYKKKIDRWFFWETTYYNNYQGRMGDTNVFKAAHTFGGKSKTDPILGETGWNYSNGDGVLFYPGTDRLFPADSYGVEGPFASLRLKHWRRGLQDVDYLTMAAAINPGAVQALVQKLIPKVLWEYGVDDMNDPTYVRGDVSWSNNPKVWETARAQLAEIIEGGAPR